MKDNLNFSLSSVVLQRLACFGLALWGVLPQALGQYETWTFSGTITSTTEGGIFYPGQNCSWSFAIDPSRLAPSSSGLYYPTAGFSFRAGNYGYSGSSLGSGVLIANDQPVPGGGSFDGIIFSPVEQDEGFPTGVQFDGSALGVTLLNYSSGPTATPFTSTSFPSTLNLNNFSQLEMTMYFQGGGNIIGSVNDFYINGTLLSQVPEPDALALFGIGLLLLTLKQVFPRSQTP